MLCIKIDIPYFILNKTEIKMKTETSGRLLLSRLLLLSFQERQKREIADCFKGLFGVLTPQNSKTHREGSRGRVLFCVCIMDVTSNCSLKPFQSFKICHKLQKPGSFFSFGLL